jgi:putative ABC transport system permease protein
MSLSLRPTLSALLRNRTGATLVALQIAIALAVLVNALYIVHQHVEKMSRPTRIDESNLFGLYSFEYTAHFDYNATLQEDLAWMRSLPGVVDATPANAMPLGISGSASGFTTLPEDKGNRAEVNFFQMDEHGLNTLGVRLLAGRNFRADEILPAESTAQPHQIIITQAVANKLFPHENALGRVIYDGSDAVTIIGIIDDMIGTGYWGYESPVQVGIYPQLPQRHGHGYLVRSVPKRRDALMRQVEQHLSTSNQDRVIMRVHAVEQDKRDLYATDRAMGDFLVAVTMLMVAVTALGIFSLATFNVATRTRQIGTRRAVGARRRDIVSYFLVENGVITAAGVVVGCLLALGIGSWLSYTYAMPRLDLYYLVGGVLLIWIVGQLAAWWPARRASAVSPSVATRTV